MTKINPDTIQRMSDAEAAEVAMFLEWAHDTQKDLLRTLRQIIRLTSPDRPGNKGSQLAEDIFYIACDAIDKALVEERDQTAVRSSEEVGE